MDTSNSVLVPTSVTSNKMWYLAHGLKVPQKDITPEEYLVIIRSVVKEVKPKLEQLSGFTEFGNLVRSGRKEFGSGFSDKEFCAFICATDEKPSGSNLIVEALYFARNARFVYCRTTEFCDEHESPVPYQPHDHHIVCWATDEDVLSILRSKNEHSDVLGVEIITAFGNLAQGTLDGMEKRRQSVEKLKRDILAILSRVER